MASLLVALLFFLRAPARASCSEFETYWQNARSAGSSLAQDARAYLVSLLGKQTVDSLLTTVANAGTAMSEAAAHGLNVVGGWIIDFLDTAGIAHLSVDPVTPEGLIFVAWWALLAVIGYWLLSLVVSLLVGVVRKVLFLLKLVLVAAAFGWIVSDVSASAETTAMRLGGLVLVCVVLGVGSSSFRRDGSDHLERKVKALERRLGEVEKNKKDE